MVAGAGILRGSDKVGRRRNLTAECRLAFSP